MRNLISIPGADQKGRPFYLPGVVKVFVLEIQQKTKGASKALQY